MNKIKTYLIVDDDMDDQQFLLEALTENDHVARFFTSYDAQETINDLKKALIPIPDAIFLDLNMPGMSGKQFLSELKGYPSLAHVPVIIYSTTSDRQEILESMKLGASYFLVKGSSFSELKERLASITHALEL